MYGTVQAAGGDHLRMLDLSATSTLVPTQVSSLTIPNLPGKSIGGHVPVVQFCSSQVIAKNLADPSTAFLVLGLVTDPSNLCLPVPGATAYKWLVTHLSDGPGTELGLNFGVFLRRPYFHTIQANVSAGNRGFWVANRFGL